MGLGSLGSLTKGRKKREKAKKAGVYTETGGQGTKRVGSGTSEAARNARRAAARKANPGMSEAEIERLVDRRMREAEAAAVKRRLKARKP